MSIVVVGGGGFIGSFLCERWHAKSFDLKDGNDAHDLELLTKAMRGCDTVVHLASNADIAAGAEDPTIDFRDGTVLTQNVCEAARLVGVDTMLYASGSGVYGRPWPGYTWFHEEDSLLPVSPYGASKVAGEALVAAYAAMYGFRGVAFRFANVVGAGQTHGVGFDFVRKLRADPELLEIMGDGEQAKGYIGVDDAASAMAVGWQRVKQGEYQVFNVGSPDTITVREIAGLACDVVGVQPEFGFGPSWPGDVPCVELCSTRIRNAGWKCSRSSWEAMRWALEGMCGSLQTPRTSRS